MASLSLVVLAVVFTNLCIPTCAYHFLILGGDGGGSHYYVAAAIGKELASRGNKVTVLVSDMYADSVSNGNVSHLYNLLSYKSLVTEGDFQDLITKLDETGKRGDMVSMIANIGDLETIHNKQCRSILIDDHVIDFLHREKFDLIIGDLWYICVGIVAQLLDTPFVLLSPTAVSMSLQSQINVCPTNPAYIPELVSGLDTKLSFFGRVSNTLILSLTFVPNRRMLHGLHQIKVDLNIKPEISLYETLSKADLFFVNTNFVLDFPRL
ncbi:UDP-glucuronosyltransferase 1-2-like [Amphiura filiformis]|uniref:UDP-glucuronosyltransferase 1-2-like n=1 Tax=Amphiura filiformis TaxID=82378 RepID=UPI003B20BE95